MGRSRRRAGYGCSPAPPRIRLLTDSTPDTAAHRLHPGYGCSPDIRPGTDPARGGGGGGAPQARAGRGWPKKRMGIPTKARAGWGPPAETYGYPPEGTDGVGDAGRSAWVAYRRRRRWGGGADEVHRYPSAKARAGWGMPARYPGIRLPKAQVGWRCRQRAYGYPPKVQAGWGRPARYPGIRLRRPAGAGSTRSTGLGGERQRGGDRPDLHPTWRPHAGSPRAVKEGRGSVPVCVLEQFLVPQDIALNLSGYGLWEFRDKLDRSRVFVRGGGVPDVGLDLPDQRLGWLVTGL